MEGDAEPSLLATESIYIMSDSQPSKHPPYYISRAQGAGLSDISKGSIAWFVERAKNERDYTFSGRGNY